MFQNKIFLKTSVLLTVKTHLCSRVAGGRTEFLRKFLIYLAFDAFANLRQTLIWDSVGGGTRFDLVKYRVTHPGKNIFLRSRSEEYARILLSIVLFNA